MFTKTIYIPFTVESKEEITKEEITNRQAQIIANRARGMFISNDLDDEKLKDVAEYNGFEMIDWKMSPSKSAEEVMDKSNDNDELQLTKGEVIALSAYFIDKDNDIEGYDIDELVNRIKAFAAK